MHTGRGEVGGATDPTQQRMTMTIQGNDVFSITASCTLATPNVKTMKTDRESSLKTNLAASLSWCQAPKSVFTSGEKTTHKASGHSRRCGGVRQEYGSWSWEAAMP